MKQWRVHDVMTNQVLMVSADARPTEALHMINDHDVSALAVVDEFDTVIGVLTRTDILNAVTPGEEPARRRWWKRRSEPVPGWRDTSVRRMMSAPAITIGPGATLARAGRDMNRAGVKRLLVTDHRRHLLGVVAAADLLKVYARDDDAVRADIHTVLRPAGIATVRIDVDHGVVTLTGGVRDRTTARLLRNLTHAAPGVVDVVTDLAVPPSPPAPKLPEQQHHPASYAMDGWWGTRRPAGAAVNRAYPARKAS